MRGEKTNSYITHNWGNSSEKVSKIPETFDSKYLRWGKIDLSKETKEGSKKR